MWKDSSWSGGGDGGQARQDLQALEAALSHSCRDGRAMRVLTEEAEVCRVVFGTQDTETALSQDEDSWENAVL